MSHYRERPWLARYAAGQPADITSDYPTMLHAWEAAVDGHGQDVAITYFDGELTFAEINDRADALAVALGEHGFATGDRLGIYTQNNPAFVIGLLAGWKAGGSCVLINPMNKQGELTHLLTDSGATALLCLDTLYVAVAKEVIDGGTTQVRTVITCSALDHQTRNDQRLFADLERPDVTGTLDLQRVYQDHRGKRPEPVDAAPEDLALLVYTSGTTGAPKGSMSTQANVVFNAQAYREWMSLTPQDRVLAVAPLFHITGMIGHVAVAMLTACPLVLAHRFEPTVMLDVIKERRPTFTVGAITVFISLAGIDGVSTEDWSSFRAIYSGGAPIAPAITESFEAKTGHYIHNIYGLTETNSPSHAVPFGARAPVDPNSGALSVGVPTYNTTVRIVNEDGNEAPPGEIGEIMTSGPQVVSGYWQRPDATREGIPNGELRTGDVGFMDAQGWFYLVDRKKDMINASGYKVWPREVEDVLYGHPAVREAAVVGVPDGYRGESVKGFVSFKPDAKATPEELIDYCKQRLAAYKYPREIEIVDELPKTPTGKILRRNLRQAQR